VSPKVRLPMMSHHYEISVGEPWDFEGPDGSNRILAKAEGIVTGKDRPAWQGGYLLMRVKTPFKMNGKLVTLLVAAPRYVGDTLSDVISGGCPAGIAKVCEGQDLRAGDKFEASQVEHCIIGSGRPITKCKR
jgi:hypothetical protein